MEHATGKLSQRAGVALHVMEPSGLQSSKKSWVRGLVRRGLKLTTDL